MLWGCLMAVLPLIGCYVVTSLVLLRFPWILHKKKTTKIRCKHISHRGGAGENLENTMTAFRNSVALGTEMLELDVHLTADKQVVVCHDGNLKRQCLQNVLVEETNYQDLPSLNSWIAVQFEPGHICSCTNSDRKIPLLKDVFEAWPDLPINVDIKVNSDELIDKVNDLVCEYNREHLTVWGNASNVITEKCYKKNPNIPLLFSLKRCIFLVFLFYSGLLPFIPLKESFLEIFLPKPMLRRPELSQRERQIVQLVDIFLISPTLFRHLERRGIQTFLWVLNHETDYAYAFEKLKVAGVMTDFPSRLSNYLKDKNTNKKPNNNKIKKLL